jgi:hypothetical protein
LTGGVFTSYNEVPLSAGDYYLIEERNEKDIVVRQPLGADTQLTVKRLQGWGPSDSIEAWACAKTGEVLSSQPVTATAQGITFSYQQWAEEGPIYHYRVTVPCKGDLDHDGDVDGSDLNGLGSAPGLAELSLFAADLGRIDCPIR